MNSNEHEKDEKPGYVTCPYDAHHSIRKTRLPIHLKKCAKQHPEVALAMCPFNSVHRVLSHQLKDHESICPDRKALDPAAVSVRLPAGLLPVPVETSQADPSKQYWDDQITIGNTLDSVRENAKVHNVYLTHNLSGSKAEKKLRKNEERLRFGLTKSANNVISEQDEDEED